MAGRRRHRGEHGSAYQEAEATGEAGKTMSQDNVLRIEERGGDLLRDPRLNKGTAFTEAERVALGLEGLLPHHVATLEEQVVRVLANFRRKESPLEQYIYLRSLQDRNETLFYAALVDHIEEMMPVVYTPTVAEAVEEFSHIFRSARGLYVTPEDADRMEMLFENAPCDEVGVIVCTDNEGILGIGDQGTGGMAIPIGKLALYVAVGGFRPEQCLPICLDVGTENEALLDDPLYLGVKAPRLRGEAYHEFIGAFVDGVKQHAPQAVLQWEDFSRANAFDNLARYRDEVTSFNDDIQGTAGVTVAALMGAANLAGRDFADDVVCIIGAGGAGVGVALGIIAALQVAGVDAEEARRRVYVVDSKGLVADDRDDLAAYKKVVAFPAGELADWPRRSLHDIIRNARPTALIGLSGHPGAIDAESARLMASVNERPAIFPMSNPTSKAEAVPEDLLRWTDGRAIIATGSPFEPVEYGGRTHAFSQANNVYVFPGVGLGAYTCGASMISDGMFSAAARKLSELVEDDDRERGLVLPPVSDLRQIAAEVGAAVVGSATEEGLARDRLQRYTAADLRADMYTPYYDEYRPA